MACQFECAEQGVTPMTATGEATLSQVEGAGRACFPLSSSVHKDPPGVRGRKTPGESDLRGGVK